ncbi:MAG: LysE family transporter [Ignavibacteriales bacterium]|nr:LysE family transporter [Ignavibacteriales bacterium]
MEPLLFLRGLLIGFAMAVPIGPIGIMCIRMTLSDGRMRGFIIGLGAATADMLYGCVAAFGLTVISNVLETQRFGIRLAGGILLLILGIQVYRAKSRNLKFNSQEGGTLKLYFYTVALTMTNPFTVFAFLAVFAMLGLADFSGAMNASFLVAGIFTGSGLWFFLLSYGASLFRDKLNTKGLRWTNRIAGIIIFISGAIAIVSILP